MKRILWKIILGIVVLLVLLGILLSCSSDEDGEDSALESSETSGGEDAEEEDTEAADGENQEDSEDTADAAELTYDGSLRSFYTSVDQAENVTVMVYMIGSNLESEGAAASGDIQEMAEAELGDNINIVMELGGANQWYLDADIDPSVRNRFVLNGEGLTQLEDGGSGSMVDPDALTDFVSFAAANYPADRYMLIFWDHGGGTMGGFGQDELYDLSDSLSLPEIGTALKNTGVKFDIVGFDACLMATIETAYALEPYADYLLASEELEPGNGWYYTDALTGLSIDPAMSSIDFGKQIIDDFDSFYSGSGEGVTLSLTDLREIPAVYHNLSEFLLNAGTSISADNSQFAGLSRARNNACEYGQGELDQVDIADLASKSSFEGQENLIAAISSCVKYHNDSLLDGSNGLAMYFPYSQIGSYSSTKKMLGQIGFKSPVEFYNYFLSVMSGAGGSFDTNTFLQTMEQDYTQENWYEPDAAQFDYQLAFQSPMPVGQGAEGPTILLSEEQKELINDIELNVMVQFQDGYVYLGKSGWISNLHEDGFVMDFDYVWPALNGTLVSYIEDPLQTRNGLRYYTGTIPATVNGVRADIHVEWQAIDDTKMDVNSSYSGKAVGYRIVREGSSTYERGLRQFKKGDEIQPLIGYYEDNEKIADIDFNNVITVEDPDQMIVESYYIQQMPVMYWATIRDIYNHEYDSEQISNQ